MAEPHTDVMNTCLKVNVRNACPPATWSSSMSESSRISVSTSKFVGRGFARASISFWSMVCLEIRVVRGALRDRPRVAGIHGPYCAAGQDDAVVSLVTFRMPFQSLSALSPIANEAQSSFRPIQQERTMKTNQQTFESATASDSNDLTELDESSLSQVGGGVIYEPFVITRKPDVAAVTM